MADVLFDRKLVLMKDGRYMLMLQMGDSNVKDFLNGRHYIHKYWRAFSDKNNQIFFTMGELQHRIYQFIAENIREDGSTHLLYKKGVHFSNPNHLRRFFTDGLASRATFEQFTAANNHFCVGYKEKNGDEVKFRVDTEEEMLERLQEFQQEKKADTYIGFEERNLLPLNMYGKFTVKETSVEQWYAIVGFQKNEDKEDTKIYYRRSSNKRLLFTEDIEEAKVFLTEDAAQQQLKKFPMLKNPIEMVVEQQNTTALLKSREFNGNIAEMG